MTPVEFGATASDTSGISGASHAADSAVHLSVCAMVALLFAYACTVSMARGRPCWGSSEATHGTLR